MFVTCEMGVKTTVTFGDLGLWHKCGRQQPAGEEPSDTQGHAKPKVA